MIPASQSAWRLNTDGKKAAGLQPSNLLDVASRFRGQSKREDWLGPPTYDILDAAQGFKDFVGFMTGAPVVSRQAKDFIETQLSPEGAEFLDFGPLASRRYFVLNVTTVIDAVDWGQSDVFFSAPKAEGNPKLIALKEAIPPRICFFKLERLRDYVFIQDDWAAKLAASGLTGFGLTCLQTDVLKLILGGKRPNEHPLIAGHYNS